MSIFSPKKDEALNADVAGQMLQNIFDECEVEPNTVPLDDLQSYSNYRKDRFFMQKVILVIIMLLFLALPLMFFGPKIDVIEQTSQAPTPTYSLDVSSLLPITSVKATVNGQNVPVYEKDKRVYSVEPEVSGEMTITVTCVNNQYVSTKVNVSTIDREVPQVVNDKVKDGLVYIYLKDAGSGIDYKSITARDMNQNSVELVKYDADEGWIAFDYPVKSINISIPDKSENILQLALTIK
mgnify:CR=1 FL=1